MNIYFCDICNQSIPIKDIDDGVAVIVRGKMVCAACNAVASGTALAQPGTITDTAKASSMAPSMALPSLSPAGSTPAPHGSLGRDLFIIAVAAAAGVAVSYYLLKENARDVDARLVTELSGIRDDGRKLGKRVETFAATLDEMQGNLNEISRQLKTEEEVSAARTRKSIGEFDSRFEQVKAYVAENERVKDQMQQFEMRSTAVGESVTNLQKDISQMRATMVELAGLIAKGASAPPPAPVNPSVGDPGPDVKPADPGALQQMPLPNELQAAAKKLKAPGEGDRWDAVDALGRSRDPRVVPYIVPMLKDTDVFVRQCTANVLGELNKRSKHAVPYLIDSLDDENSYVRDAVSQALRKITDQNIKFDTYGKKEDQKKQQKTWRTWWDQNSEKFLAT
ncbi:MAG: HEAT repeat domain-containing protein [Planctomycetes bacterium]|nr:HEAT repeat domain-containing protein [Planctomycetota bacterium]